MTDLATETCTDLPAGTLPLSEPDARARLPEGWEIAGGRITRRYNTADFAQALALVNRIGALAEEMNHHPDMRFGWGYVEVQFFTHSIKGLSRNDLIAAAKLNAAGVGA